MDYRGVFQIGRREAEGFYLYQTVRYRLPGILGFGVVGLLTCYLYGSGRIMPPSMLWGAMALSFALVVAGILFGYWVSIRRKLARSAARTGRDTYTQTITVNGFGVRAEVDGREARVGFDKLHEVRETGRAFYLYLTREEAWILPKAQMADPAGDSARLREIFGRVIESRRLRVKG